MPKPPRISGNALRVVAAAARIGPLRKALVRMMRSDLGVDALPGIDVALRGKLPSESRPVQARANHDRPSLDLGPLPTHAWPRGIVRYAEAFRSGRTTPTEVAMRAFAAARALDARTPPMSPFLSFDEAGALRAADEATARWRELKPRSPLDGVPVAVKEQTDMRGLPTRVGTALLPPTPAADDATVVARLRATGAVILGHTVMTELGMSPIGVNPHRRMPRNPHDERRLAGGSSTGTAVAVAAGLVPTAIGADGGGSIRIPASHTGVFGIKPTFGRVSEAGDAVYLTLNAQGPLGASTNDLAAMLEVIGGEDPRDPWTRGAAGFPAGTLQAAVGRGVRGVRIGVDEDEWAAASPEIAQTGRSALAALEREGAFLVPVRMKLAKHAPAVGYVTIGLESYADVRDLTAHHMDELGHDLQVLYLALQEFEASEYLDAQRIRAGMQREVAQLLTDVDVLALPSVMETAARATDAEVRTGFLDSGALQAHCRFAFLANLTGLPAASAPIGRDGDGMPIGLQIMGDAWDEAAVLQVLGHLERAEISRVVRPKVAVDLLE